MFSTQILAATQQGSPLTLLFIPLMFAAMYFLIIRPQRRRQKEQMALQSALTEGDEVLTTSGIYGFITGFDGDIIWLEIDDNVQIRVARAAVQRRVDTSGASADTSTSSKGSTDIAELADDDGKSAK